MSAPRLSRTTLDELKKHHIAFLEQRLVGDQAHQDWLQAVRDGHESLLSLRIREVLDAPMITNAVVGALNMESAREFYVPIFRELAREALTVGKGSETTIDELLAPELRQAAEKLLESRDLIPAPLVRKVFEQRAVEDAMHDTLYDGLTQFNTTANPFFAEWGLPAILKKMPFGGGMILASMDAMRSEFDRRLEPEIRKFLATFSRSATGQLTELVISRSGDPKFIELRKNIASFLYAQSISDLLADVDDEIVEKYAALAEDTLSGVLERGLAEEQLRTTLEAMAEEVGDMTFDEWLSEHHIVERPDLDSLAEALWPHVEQALRSPIVLALLTEVTSEFYDGL
jgi:hypothetical protein